MKKIKALLVSSLLFANASFADQILYTAENLGGNSWQYNYTIDNTGTSVLDWFTVFFDVGLFENLLVTASPADWDSLVVQPDPFLPDDGFFDSLVFGAGVNPGEILGGFSVSFDFLGIGAPGEQFFEFLGPDFVVLADGFTLAAGGPTTSVPEPGTLALLMAGLILVLVASPGRRRRLPAANVAF